MEGEGEEAGPASGSGRELSRLGRKAKFPKHSQLKVAEKQLARGSLWVLMTRYTRQAYGMQQLLLAWG